MWWFRKKKIVDTNGNKVKNYKLKLTIRAMCLFEQLRGKSFLAIDDEDMEYILYAMFVTSNSLKLSKPAFDIIMQDASMVRWMSDEYHKQMKFDGQLSFYNRVNDAGVTKEEIDEARHNEPDTISSIAGSLIARGMDADYVMNQMELWEIDMYNNAFNDINKETLERERLFTWISMMPHLDKKSAAKLKHPSDLIAFPWDKDVKDRKQQELEANTKGAMAFLNKASK